MSDLYRKKQLQKLIPWEPNMPMALVSISDADKENGSPKQGDMIAINPDNATDMWLVAEKFFNENYEPADKDENQSLREQVEAKDRDIDTLIESQNISMVENQQLKDQLSKYRELEKAAKTAISLSWFQGTRLSGGNNIVPVDGLKQALSQLGEDNA